MSKQHGWLGTAGVAAMWPGWDGRAQRAGVRPPLSDKRRLRSMKIYGRQHSVIMYVTVDRGEEREDSLDKELCCGGWREREREEEVVE